MLLVAVESGELEIVKMWSIAGVDPTTINHKGISPLTAAKNKQSISGIILSAAVLSSLSL